ncbi:MAG TPA: tRNA (N(6)-L-threonylcarbamoyladenosine(37)-C(2))-methylthiotransferase MtaB, partial [Deltaproteobacteria bacterium]|nr:tRNA (N(6)-L-threonylcarbamoyladenosine(37)-C(2))-methylthiotransferase MtaB [Deltaproteobacteria bacterium]
DDSAFMETYRLIEIMDIYYLHVFPYSLREGTTAASMTPAVPDFVKRKRVQALRQLDAIKRKAFYMRFLERRLKILPEGKKYSNLFMKGYTDNYIPVYIPFKKNLVNHFTDVIIKELQGNILLGRVL